MLGDEIGEDTERGKVAVNGELGCWWVGDEIGDIRCRGCWF